MKLSRKTWLQLSTTALIRTVLNTGFRMVFPFQPILMEGFGISLARISRMYAGQSLVGLLSPFLASVADTRGRKTGMLTGLVIFSLGVLVVLLVPTPLGFFFFLVLSMLGKSIFDPSLQAYFGDNIPYSRRGFVMGILEMSWSLSFFLGMPLIGFVLSRFGLLEPFLVLAVLSLASILVVLGLIPPDGVPRASGETVLSKLKGVLRTGPALAGLVVMTLICLSNQLVNVVFGVWLNSSFGMQIAALGGASALIGLAELLGESGVSVLADRLNKQRAVLIGLGGSILASILLPLIGGAVWGAYLGLFAFYLTFEFTIVSLIPLMTGVLPQARGTVMALTIASANLGRGLGSLAAAPMYSGGFWVNALSAALVNLLAIVCLRYVIVQEEG
ncbi:MAG: MFS transporter [Anaerolineales bacterium]